MATEPYLETMQELSKDYLTLVENIDKRITFSFNDYCNNYFKFLESEEQLNYTEDDDDLLSEVDLLEED